MSTPHHATPPHPRSDEFSGQLDIDLGNLTAYDPAPIEAAAYAGAGREAACAETARAMAQTLVGEGLCA